MLGHLGFKRNQKADELTQKEATTLHIGPEPVFEKTALLEATGTCGKAFLNIFARKLITDFCIF